MVRGNMGEVLHVVESSGPRMYFPTKELWLKVGEPERNGIVGSVVKIL